MSMALLGLKNIDCYVQLKKLDDEEIALLCRPKPHKSTMLPKPQQSTIPTKPEVKLTLSTPFLQVIAENVPEPVAFEEVVDSNTGNVNEFLFIFMIPFVCLHEN